MCDDVATKLAFNSSIARGLFGECSRSVLPGVTTVLQSVHPTRQPGLDCMAPVRTRAAVSSYDLVGVAPLTACS